MEGVHFSWPNIDSLASVIVIKQFSIAVVLVGYSKQLNYVYEYLRE